MRYSTHEVLRAWLGLGLVRAKRQRGQCGYQGCWPTLISAISCLAALASDRSIVAAAFNTSSRAASMSVRDSAMSCRIVPCAPIHRRHRYARCAPTRCPPLSRAPALPTAHPACTAHQPKCPIQHYCKSAPSRPHLHRETRPHLHRDSPTSAPRLAHICTARLAHSAHRAALLRQQLAERLLRCCVLQFCASHFACCVLCAVLIIGRWPASVCWCSAGAVRYLLREQLAERLARGDPLDHQPQRALGDADRAHAMVDSARAEPPLQRAPQLRDCRKWYSCGSREGFLGWCDRVHGSRSIQGPFRVIQGPFRVIHGPTRVNSGALEVVRWRNQAGSRKSIGDPSR